jgi:hypothetical protein
LSPGWRRPGSTRLAVAQAAASFETIRCLRQLTETVLADVGPIDGAHNDADASDREVNRGLRSLRSLVEQPGGEDESPAWTSTAPPGLANRVERCGETAVLRAVGTRTLATNKVRWASKDAVLDDLDTSRRVRALAHLVEAVALVCAGVGETVL